jgi:hypothetical protein
MTDELDDADAADATEDAAGRPKLLGESLRKAVLSGMTALFMTEEGIRSALSDLRLPKDALAYLSQQTERTRKELFRAVSQEIKTFLLGMDLAGALRKALIGTKVEIRAELKFSDAGVAVTRMETHVVDTDEAPPPPPPRRRARRGA